MATTKVSALPAKTSIGGSEELLINDGGTSKKVTATNLLAGAAVSDGSITTAKIADDAVTEAKLANAINTAIAANTAKVGITTSQANAITANTAKVTNATHTGDVTGATELTIASGAVETGMIADDAVTAAKLANSINTEIAANTAKVTNATHTGDVTGATTLTIANDAVTVDKLNLISTGSVPSLEAKGTSGVTDGYIQLNCSENSHGIKLKSPPHSAGASYTLTFPNDDGSANEVLTTNGSGVLTWEAAGGNTTTNGLYEHAHTISANYSITSGNNAMTAGPITINSGVSVTIPTGSTWVIA
jgi:hypothetical protein